MPAGGVRTATTRRPHTGPVPELPEVETLRRGLAATVLGKRIESVLVLWGPSFDVEHSRFDALVAGHQITAIRRRGKVLLGCSSASASPAGRAEGNPTRAGGRPRNELLPALPAVAEYADCAGPCDRATGAA